MDLRPGQRIDHYTLLEPLGEGGQGSVWKVLDPRDGGVERALKLVSLAETGPAAFERARREAGILAVADHPALVTCHGLFEDPRAGLVGLVMDLVPGESLADLAARERLDEEHLSAVVVQLAAALAAVHARDLVHRDLKPENVIVTDTFRADPRAPGAIKLVDFGIARPAGDARRLTATGQVIGTLPYLAPELIDPTTWGRTEGPARDVFALGVLAYQLRSGKHPTRLGANATIVDYARAYKAAEAALIPWPPPDLAGPVGKAIAACLTLRPAERPRDGAAIVALLRGESPTATRRNEWSGAYGPTSPHREITERTPLPSSVERTAPMPVSPKPLRASPAPTIAQPPAPIAVTPPAARAASPSPAPRGTNVVTTLITGVIVALLVIVGGFVIMALWPKTSPAPENPSPPPEPAPSYTATSKPLAAAQDHGACCRADKPCLRERSRFACPLCEGEPPRLDPARVWRIHIGGATQGIGADRICFWVKGSSEPQVCHSYSALPDLSREGGNPSVSLEDIDSGKLLFTLSAGGREIASGPGQRRSGSSVFATALCMGLVLLVDGREDAPVTVYLDDR